MKKIFSRTVLAALAIAVGMILSGSVLHAQNTPATTPDQTQQSPDAATQTQQPPTPEAPPQSQQTPDPAQTPDANTTKQAAPADPTAAATDSQTFAGTVVKQGDKYVLKDEAGHTYDIDHQDEVKKFEGKRVKVQGTLDATGKKIMVK